MRTVEGADKIVYLKDGIVSEQGRPSELRNTDSDFAKMLNIQKETETWTIS